MVCGKAAFRAFFFSSKIILSLIRCKISHIIMFCQSKVKEEETCKKSKKGRKRGDETIKSDEKGRKRKKGVDKEGVVW